MRGSDITAAGVRLTAFGGFSWKRAIGVSAATAWLSRRIGIPLTKSGRQRTLGRMVSGRGLVTLLCVAATPVAVVVLVRAHTKVGRANALTQLQKLYECGEPFSLTLLPNGSFEIRCGAYLHHRGPNVVVGNLEDAVTWLSKWSQKGTPWGRVDRDSASDGRSGDHSPV